MRENLGKTYAYIRGYLARIKKWKRTESAYPLLKTLLLGTIDISTTACYCHDYKLDDMTTVLRLVASDSPEFITSDIKCLPCHATNALKEAHKTESINIDKFYGIMKLASKIVICSKDVIRTINYDSLKCYHCIISDIEKDYANFKGSTLNIPSNIHLLVRCAEFSIAGFSDTLLIEQEEFGGRRFF